MVEPVAATASFCAAMANPAAASRSDTLVEDGDGFPPCPPPSTAGTSGWLTLEKKREAQKNSVEFHCKIPEFKFVFKKKKKI